jgi:hypothetical protein
MIALNGHAPEPEPTPLQSAQQRLVDLAMKQPMNGTALISAFVNGLLQSAKINALTDMVMDDGNATWTKQERLESLLIHHLGIVADQVESASQQPRIAIASGLRAN